MSSSEARPTLEGIYELISRKVFRPSTINIYVFLRLHSNEVIPYHNISKYTSLHVKTIGQELNALEAAELLERTKVKNSVRYKTVNMKADILKELSASASASSSSSPKLSRLSRIVRAILDSRAVPIKNISYDYSRGRREAKFANDKDWIAAKAILARHIPESFLDPLRLGEKRFMKLCELLLDESFDLEAYTKWYRVEKFVRLRFNWNMFLLPSMVDEYRIIASDLAESEQHLRTSSKEMKAKHSKAAAKDKEWIEKNIMPRMGKNVAKTRSKRSSARDS